MMMEVADDDENNGSGRRQPQTAPCCFWMVSSITLSDSCFLLLEDEKC